MSSPISSDPSSDARVKLWRRLLTAVTPFRLKSIRIIESDVFHPQVIEFPRVSAIVGAHGLGKTILLRMIEAAFGYTEDVDLPPFFAGGHSWFPVSHVKGRIEVRLTTPSGELRRNVDLGESPESRAAVWGDLGDRFTARYVSPFTCMNELSMVFNSGSKSPIREWRKLARAELDALRDVLGWAYDSVTVNEIPLYLEESGEMKWTIPFVCAWLNSAEVDTTMMSHGELWVHYLHWFLEEAAGTQSLALIDEPETFLAVRSQRPLMDRTARSVLANNHQMILSTHSPEMISRFPLENIRLCVRANGKVRVISPSSFSQVRDAIGIEVPVKVIALVEDVFAAKILETILSHFDYTLLRELEILPVAGASEVISGVRTFRELRRLSCFGVLDGDQRPAGKAVVPATRLPILYLPGDDSPEAELLKCVRNNTGQVARAIGRSDGDISAALSSVNGLDHQYQIRKFAKELGYSELVVSHLLSDVWMRNSSIRRAAHALVGNIRSIVSSAR